jgi:hypothetical protein
MAVYAKRTVDNQAEECRFINPSRALARPSRPCSGTDVPHYEPTAVSFDDQSICFARGSSMNNPCPTCGSARDELETGCSSGGWSPPKQDPTTNIHGGKERTPERWGWLRFLWPLCFSIYCLAIIIVPLTRSIYSHYQAKSWIPIEATVLSAEEDFRNQIDFTYEYQFRKTSYHGSQFAFLSVTIYRETQPITIFVDPHAPENSVVRRRNLTFRFLAPSILMIVLIVVVNAIVSWLWLHHRHKLLAAIQNDVQASE